MRCSDEQYYVGITNDIERRLNEHNIGLHPTAFTYERRPVLLVYSSEFKNVDEAIAWEKQIKRWSKKKKEALIDNNWDQLITLSRRKSVHKGQASRRSLRSLLSQTRKAVFQVCKSTKGPSRNGFLLL